MRKRTVIGKEVRWVNSQGDLDREGKPAVLHPEYEMWYKEGNLHRLDGPAFYQILEGNKIVDDVYAIEGKLYKKKELWSEAIITYKLNKIKDL